MASLKRCGSSTGAAAGICQRQSRKGRQRHDSLPLGGFNQFATGIPGDPWGKGLDVDFFFEHPLFVDVFPRVSS